MRTIIGNKKNRGRRLHLRSKSIFKMEFHGENERKC